MHLKQVCLILNNSTFTLFLGFSEIASTSKAEPKPEATPEPKEQPKPEQVAAEESESSGDSDFETGFISVSKHKKRKLAATKEGNSASKKSKLV
jgi:hypothetical protein